MEQTGNQEYHPINFRESEPFMNGGNERVMSLAENQEYQIFLTHIPAASANGDSPKSHWWATLLGFPFIVETAVTRHEVLAQIKQRIADMIKNAEIVTVRASELAELTMSEPVLSPVSAAQTKGKSLTKDDDIDREQLMAMGWDDYGLYSNEPDAMLLFDEIEEERNKHLVGGEA